MAIVWDSNKRTSTVVASKILIESENGILIIGKTTQSNSMLHLMTGI